MHTYSPSAGVLTALTVRIKHPNASKRQNGVKLSWQTLKSAWRRESCLSQHHLSEVYISMCSQGENNHYLFGFSSAHLKQSQLAGLYLEWRVATQRPPPHQNYINEVFEIWHPWRCLVL